MHDADRSAIQAVTAGDSQAFRALVDRHGRYVYRVAHRLTGNPSDAEDVAQDAFLKAYRQLGRFESRADFRTWIHRITVNCAIDFIRARRYRETAHDPADLDRDAPDAAAASHAPAPDRQYLSAEIGARVHEGLGGLTALERAAFMLRHVEGCSISEIGAALGLKTEAAKHSVFRAVRKMRLALEPLVDVRHD
ncbi:MAG: sigma-70 family RNA polymerase sigma factor [Vicinamibacterales bacterium]